MDNNNMMNQSPDGQFNPDYQNNTNVQGNPAPQYYGNGQYGQSYQSYQPYQPYQENIYAQPGESKAANGKAVASMICGICALLLCCCYGVPAIILGIVAIVLAILAKKDNMGQFPGMAVAGLIMGIIGIVMGVIYIVILILAVMGEGMYS